MKGTIRLYEAELHLYGQVYSRPVSARSRAEARYRAFLDADLDMPFRDYQRACRVRLYRGELADDGYGYVRRAYGVDPRIGQRITLTGEGKDWEGREGEIVYPYASRHYVHVIFDTLRHPVVVHPQSVVFPPEQESNR